MATNCDLKLVVDADTTEAQRKLDALGGASGGGASPSGAASPVPSPSPAAQEAAARVRAIRLDSGSKPSLSNNPDDFGKKAGEVAGKAIGKYKVKITFKDWYSGEVTKTVKVVPKGTSISSVKSSSKKAMTVKWKKQTSQTTGYQIQYSTTKDFSSGNKTITIKKNKTTSRTIKKLKSGKTYYVRVRTYKTKSGSKYYSEWSSTKSVKVK